MFFEMGPACCHFLSPPYNALTNYTTTHRALSTSGQLCGQASVQNRDHNTAAREYNTAAREFNTAAREYNTAARVQTVLFHTGRNYHFAF